MSIATYFPTLLCLLGWFEFQIQILIAGPSSRTLGITVYAVFALLVWCLGQNWKVLLQTGKELRDEILAGSWLFRGLVGVTALVLGLATWVSFQPPHSPQEFDALNYLMALPRQHLLHGSLAHIQWSAADLFPMVVSWGFAPFWFMGPTLHKIPQMLSALCGFALMLALGRHQEPTFRGWIPALAVFTTHGVMIQLGTAMLDLVALYLVLATVYAFRKRQWYWLAVHLALFTTMKSFSPIQVALVSAGSLLLHILQTRKIQWPIPQVKKGAVAAFLILVALFMTRSSLVGLHRAGTPLFPFATCWVQSASGCQGDAGDIIRQSSEALVQTRNNYGFGRDVTAFFTHLWRISVPSLGVNNEYDYPLGLAWLLWVVFLGFGLGFWIRSRQIPGLVVVAIAYWGVWWLGAHQARWLYPVLALGWLGTLPIQKRVRESFLLGSLLVSAGLSLVSEYRAVRADLFSSPSAIQERQVARLKWDEESGDLISQESLYVNRPLSSHAPVGRDFILR